MSSLTPEALTKEPQLAFLQPVTRWTRTLMLANLVGFFLAAPGTPLYYELTFYPSLALVRPWTIVTYMFLHGGFGHLFFNMLGLYFFGGRVESRLGDRWFLTLYLISGLTGALLSFLLSPNAGIIGASAAVFGVGLAYARYWPNDMILVWFVPMTARSMVIFNTVMAIWGAQGFIMPGTAHFAHLGGYLGGWLYLIYLERTSPAARFKAKATAVERGGSRADKERWRKISGDGLHPVNREELDRLRKKMEEGTELTSTEVAFLNRLSA